MRRTAIARQAVAIVLIGGAFSFGNDATADTIHVPAEFTSIQSAINAASGGDEIVIAPGTYFEALNLLGKAITVRSSAGASQTIIDAQGSGSVVICDQGEGPDTVLEGLTLTGGSGTGFPGSGGYPQGGGMLVFASSPTVRNCMFTGNSALDGGGMAIYQGSDPDVIDCIFQYNEAGAQGGGVFLWDSNALLLRCEFIGNAGLNNKGGGIGSTGVGPGSFPVIDSCTFRQNSSGLVGGGIWTHPNSQATVLCSLLCENEPQNIVGPYADQGGNILTESCGQEEAGCNQPPDCVADLASALQNFLGSTFGSFVVTEDETILVSFTGDDADGDELLVSAVGIPAGATLSTTLGDAPLTTVFEWTPTAADKAGAPHVVTITFTDPSGESTSCEFTIEDINLRPECQAGAGPDGTQTIYECEDSYGAFVTLYGSTTDSDDNDAQLMFHWDVSDISVILDDPDTPNPSGVFPIGMTMATLTVTDGRGGVDVCDVIIEVQDTVPPEVVCTTNVASLWPPKHDMRTVTITIIATDACADPEFVFPIIVTVRSDEPDNATGNGDGNTTGDVNGQDGFSGPVDITGLFTYADGQFTATVQLRAERAGSGDGRAYTIDVTAIDSQGNDAETSCVVVVPHDRRGQ